MQALEQVKVLEQSQPFQDWHKSHKSSYIVHIFKMLDELNKDIWQIGYYNKKDDTITTFFIENGEIEIAPDSKVFKEDKNVINKLDLDEVKASFDAVVQTAQEFQQEHHKGDSPSKTIVILQNLDVGQVWNITFVTKTFKTLNVKIDAATGKIVKHSLNAIFEFGK